MMKSSSILSTVQMIFWAILGVQSFSVKEHRQLYLMIYKNLITIGQQDSYNVNTSVNQSRCQLENGNTLKELVQDSSDTPASRRRAHSETEETVSEGANDERQRKRHKSDSICLTLDDNLSWCVASDFYGNQSNGSSSTDSPSSPDQNGSLSDWLDDDSVSDQFSVEFEVASIHSDDYSPNEEGLELTNEDDEIYQVTIYQTEDSGVDSFDDDPEISLADYWKCSNCNEMNPPLPCHCPRCWALWEDWLPDKTGKSKESQLENGTSLEPEKATPLDPEEGFDVPDCKKGKMDEEGKEAEHSSESQESEAYSPPSTSSSMLGSSQRESEKGH
ncbi:hypothetical protein JRQ81_010612 [Phrynocephalus forsythii]|uniref:RanBP2-type domain-containing protein n=1 Tax=Phrynocephalus forsythii TaxID=171643 RepID=A0A9Q0X7C9_9SAUR|nr:hypothetical protein JRQ81_010612 [Phrynocephalus forsythii]